MSVTTHCCDLEQGLVTRHGLRQDSLMQVKLGAQSLSTRHSGSSASIAKIGQAHAFNKSQISSATFHKNLRSKQAA